MKRSYVVMLSLVIAGVLLVTGVYGCSPASPTESISPSESTPKVQAQSEPSQISVSVNSQIEGIWVSGTGKVTVTPDIATLQLGIEAQDVSVSEAQGKASEAMDKVMAAFTEKGVAEKDIQTRSFRISQRARWDDVQQQEVIIGYRVTNQVVAKIRDMEKVSGIIDAVVIAGGNYTRINGLNFSVDDPTVYYDEAREKAIADATRKAEQIAGLAGLKLGEPTFISESAASPVYESIVLSAPAPMPIPAPAPTIAPSVSPGEVEIIINIQIAYVIAGKAS
jgi:hypothetical protein